MIPHWTPNTWGEITIGFVLLDDSSNLFLLNGLEKLGKLGKFEKGLVVETGILTVVDSSFIPEVGGAIVDGRNGFPLRRLAKPWPIWLGILVNWGGKVGGENPARWIGAGVTGICGLFLIWDNPPLTGEPVGFLVGRVLWMFRKVGNPCSSKPPV